MGLNLEKKQIAFGKVKYSSDSVKDLVMRQKKYVKLKLRYFLHPNKWII